MTKTGVKRLEPWQRKLQKKLLADLFLMADKNPFETSFNTSKEPCFAILLRFSFQSSSY